ncbi:AAA family ATPase [Paenibacillus thermotolerans]|uniref:AAA family ATPase n=1 Tax=Paenibacillus thermotolerans TaxID=3027807 RepID=UPI002367AE69|nr:MULTISPECIES: AAA family ATPase [unclassified Paenibacillus]
MKPVSLSISGLQSYREEQRIDFAALCEAGVFGIFGPTGSGKSTILDAITLAMYGTVERAGNSIQGIMNALEDTLAVAFEFELAEGSDRKRYKVERTYRRKPDGNVEQRLSRLSTQENGEPVVLADKSGDVTSQVERLIGLSMTDFTRAVVLPQGKFSEFLGLKGRERREMLQRLFRLERYGDELAARLAGRRNRADTRMREVAAELQGIGDASPEQVEAAERELSAAVKAEAVCLERLSAAETKHTELARLWEWQQEARMLESDRAALEARGNEIAGMEAALAAAAAAERLHPLWSELRESAERTERLAAELRRIEAQRTEAERKEAEAREAHRTAERALSEGEAPALVRLEQLRQAMELSAQAKAGEQSAAVWSATKERALAERQACADALAKKTALRAKGADKQAELKKELAAGDVSAEERKLLSAAQSARTVWLAAVKAENAAKAEADKYGRTFAERETAVRALEGEAAGAAARMKPLHGTLCALSGGLDEALRLLTSWEAQLPDYIAAASAALAGDERRRWAQTLAAELQPGDRCPVCGSEHRSGAVDFTAEEGDAAEDGRHAHQSELQSLEKLLAEVRQLSHRIRRESVSAESALERLSAALAEARGDSGGEELRAIGNEAAAARSAADAPSGSGAAALWERYEALRRGVEQAAAQLPTLARDSAAALQAWEGCKGRLRDAAAALAAERGVLASAAAKAEAAASEAAEAQAAWERDFPGLTPETLEERVRELERRDEAAGELRERIAKSEEFLATIALELEALQLELAEKEKALAHAEAQEAAERKTLSQVKEALKRLLDGGGDAAAQAQALQGKLDGWRSAERAARAAAEEARLALEEASRALAAATEALKGAQERLQSAQSRWEEALRESPFATDEEMLSQRLSPDRRSAMEEETSRYRETATRISARLEAVLARLGGKAISEEEWRVSAEALQAVKVEREAALALRAKAERRAEQLREKHEQWMKLTKEHERLATVMGQLTKLQTVFRGNAFVEFLAEEQLYGVTRAASERLGQLTRGRYAIEVDSGGGFVIRDDANGGTKRPVSTLSGGETFLTSLSLALALSAQIQLGGKYPLEFFFLDEGFGTLDQELLDNVVSALERLHVERLAVGVISHVPELQARLPRKLLVTPAQPFGSGSRVRMESL